MWFISIVGNRRGGREGPILNVSFESVWWTKDGKDGAVGFRSREKNQGILSDTEYKTRMGICIASTWLTLRMRALVLPSK